MDRPCRVQHLTPAYPLERPRSQRARAWLLTFLLALLLGLSPISIVSAQEEVTEEAAEPPSEEDATQRARELFGQGVAHLQERRAEEAVAAFQEALHLHDAPTIRYNLALALHMLGRLSQAQIQLEAVLASNSISDEMRSGAEALHTEISAQLHGLTVHMEGALDGVHLFIGDREIPRGHWAHRIDLPPSSYRVIVRRDGEAIETRDVVLEEGVDQELTITIEPRPEDIEEPEPEPAPDPLGGAMWMPGWYIAAGGGALVLVGAILGGVALGERSALLDECGEDQICGMEVQNVQSRAEGAYAMAVTGDALLYTGIAVAAAGASLALFGHLFGLTEGEDSPELSVIGGPTGGRAQLRLRW